MMMGATDGGKRPNKELSVQRKNIGGGDIFGDFIEDVWKVSSTDVVERFRCVVVERFRLSKKDADKLVLDLRNIRRQRISSKNNKIIKIGPRNQWIKEISKVIADQIAMLVAGILFSNRNSQSERVTEKILEHLCELTGENVCIETATTRFERGLVIIADRMSSWISEAFSDFDGKYGEKHSIHESLESLTESLITFKSSESEYEESDVSVHSTDISEKEDTQRESEATLSLKSSEVSENETEESRQENDFDWEMESEDLEEEKSISQDILYLETDDGEEKSEIADEIEYESDVETTEEENDENEENEEIEFNEQQYDETSLDDKSDVSLTTDKNTYEEMVTEEDMEEIESELEEDLVEDKEYEEEDYKVEAQKDEKAIISGKESTLVIKSVCSDISRPIQEDKFERSLDILDLIKEDVARNIPKADKKSPKHKAMGEIINKRLELIAMEKFEHSLSSVIKYDIGETASVVANWIEKIMSTVDARPTDDVKTQSQAFGIKRITGSQFQVNQVSSTTVAQKVAEVRGLELPSRKTKVPNTTSPINLISFRDWADWIQSATNFGEEWGKWLDGTLADFEKHVLNHRPSFSTQDRYDSWTEFKKRRGFEAIKFRVKDDKIQKEGLLWSRKFDL